MEKSIIEKGQMFLHFDKSYMEKPRVWVKVEDAVDQPVSRFVDNQALVRHCVKGDMPSINEVWLISDRFYGEMVRKGIFTPIADLKEAEGICEELGIPTYSVEL